MDQELLEKRSNPIPQMEYLDPKEAIFHLWLQGKEDSLTLEPGLYLTAPLVVIPIETLSELLK